MCIRHGYPGPVIDALTGAFGLDDQEVVVDLGRGTGQLTLPMARQVRAVAGVDPEPDMLQRARRAAQKPNARPLDQVVCEVRLKLAGLGMHGRRA